MSVKQKFASAVDYWMVIIKHRILQIENIGH